MSIFDTNQEEYCIKFLLQVELEREELVARVDAFDAARNGYTELTEWTEAIEAIGVTIDELEETWLELSERAD